MCAAARACVLGLIVFGAAAPAAAFGPAGHRIAGLLAEPHLCAAARTEVAKLTDGEDLGEIGVWADRVREQQAWRQSAPWHYLNVDEANVSVEHPERAAALIRAHRTPPQGDVLAAIERFTRELSDSARPRGERAAALRFLVHFVVDVHQPLHIGRAADRGGNLIDVRFGATRVNLHRFWDTDVLELAGLTPQRYARRLVPRVRAAAARGDPGAPSAWAAESLALRGVVYSFEPGAAGAPVELGVDYLESAQAAVELRLVRSAERLAATLNGVFCGGAAANPSRAARLDTLDDRN